MIINQCGRDMYVVLRKDSGLWHTQCEGTDLEYWRYLWLLKCVVVNVLKYLWLLINEMIGKMCGRKCSKVH